MAKACIIFVAVLCVTASLAEGARPTRKTSTPKRFCDNPGGRDNCKGDHEFCCKELNEVKGKAKSGICCASANACPDESRLERGCVELNYLGLPDEHNPDARVTTKAKRMCGKVNERDSCKEKEFCCPQQITLKGKTTNGICCKSEAHCPDHSVDEWGCVTNPHAPRKTKPPTQACFLPGEKSDCAEGSVCCKEENVITDPIQGEVKALGICCAPGACPNPHRGEKGCLEVPVPLYNLPAGTPMANSTATPPTNNSTAPPSTTNSTATPPTTKSTATPLGPPPAPPNTQLR